MTVRETHYDPQERDLVVAAQRGDRNAFKALYDRYRDRLYNLIFYALGDELWAEDVLQIVFIKIYKGLPSFRFEAALATWVYRITVNECMNQQQRRGAEYVPFEAILGSDVEYDPESPPDLQHADNERREIIHQAVMELPPKLRAVVALKYLEGLSYDEIASALECKPGTVASRLNRALSELEARLRPLRRLL
ncbi:MAG TPA: RNA polymerase sigma factor [Blastocatellia bacterium]|nr:RNA polymerase sigma factor [Blastocatellia bacterium]